jgi:phosphate/phosphite/phosphonate ABC transporter binding protein
LQLRQGAELDRFCAALSAATGLEVSAHEIGDYSDLLDAMQAGDIDLAWLPPVVALRVTARGKTVPIALPVRGGSPHYSTALFARPDSNIQSLADLAGARAAWVDPQSAAGYIVIRASLRQRGIDITRIFGSETFYGSHAAVSKAVLGGAADVGASFVHLDPRRSKPRRAGWGDARVRMLATAGPIPGDVIAVTARLDPEKIRIVQRALVKPPTEEMRAASRALFGAEEFIVTHKEHLSPIQDLLDLVEERGDTGPRSTRLS